MFAEVLLAKASRGIDRIYHYSIPEALKEKLAIGHQVKIPFGRREETGYVVGFSEKADVPTVKDIIEIAFPEPLFDEKAVRLARWISEYYFSFFISALRLVMPPGTKGKERSKEKGGRSKEKGEAAIQNDENLLTPYTSLLTPHFRLTNEQQEAVNRINWAIDQGRAEKFLLYGITGSGKTEIYLQAIEYLLSEGKSAIVMVPEIALTPQLTQRFKERFQDHTAILHSELTEKQRKEAWGRISDGSARIVLGTRSAVFAPVKNLGLIVLDEEYETSYKSDKSPRYHAREVAFKLAELHGAVVVLGSATPSIETFFKAEQGIYRKLNLTHRIDSRPLPPVEIIDMRQEWERVLSVPLRQELKETLERREQAILFINRRGFFTFAVCRQCGHIMSCPRCSVSLVFDSTTGKLHCGKCGFTAEASIICSNCQSSSIKYFGTGTQRIEKEVAQICPTARIIRYDRDSVKKRGSHDTFFAAFAEGKADILIGTQMVAKGLDVANVTLIGVVSADTGLFLPDFRAAEHTFQLLTQVAGRAGRHHLPGKVIIQTYTPDHYVIQAAARHDYEEFYRQEIINRQELGYPPFSELIVIVLTGKEDSKILAIGGEIRQFLERRLAGTEILGPEPAPISRLRGQWRFQLLIKGKEAESGVRALAETLHKIAVPRDIRVTVDVNPLSMM